MGLWGRYHTDICIHIYIYTCVCICIYVSVPYHIRNYSSVDPWAWRGLKLCLEQKATFPEPPGVYLSLGVPLDVFSLLFVCFIYRFCRVELQGTIKTDVMC